MRQIPDFLDRQGIHVRPQADDFAASVLLALDHADNARAAYARHHLVDTEVLQLLFDHTRRAVDIEQQFGIGVNVTPPLRDLVL